MPPAPVAQPAPFPAAPGRYVPARPFPAYRHVPGQTPHPRTHRDGHSHGAPEPVCGPLTEDNWRSHEAYLFGADLFNHAYWWEAHEEWEAAWKATSDEGTRDFLQGLIQLAAALTKWHAGNERGQAKLWRRSRQNLETAAGAPFGVDVTRLLATAGNVLEGPSAPAGPKPTAGPQLHLPCVVP